MNRTNPKMITRLLVLVLLAVLWLCLRRRTELLWRWYDLYVGVYVDWPNRTLYIVPFPTIVFRAR